MQLHYQAERVLLRPFLDLDEFMRVRRGLEDEFNPFWGPMWRTEPVLRGIFADNCGLGHDSWGQLAIAERSTGRAVGIEILAPRSEGPLDGLIGTLILSESWGRGYGIEAKQLAMCYMFENYLLERVSAQTLATHRRALAGLRNCGMRHAGIVPCSQFSRGTYMAMSHWVITRAEWEQQEWLPAVRRITGQTN